MAGKDGWSRRTKWWFFNKWIHLSRQIPSPPSSAWWNPFFPDSILPWRTMTLRKVSESIVGEAPGLQTACQQSNQGWNSAHPTIATDSPTLLMWSREMPTRSKLSGNKTKRGIMSLEIITADISVLAQLPLSSLSSLLSLFILSPFQTPSLLIVSLPQDVGTRALFACLSE